MGMIRFEQQEGERIVVFNGMGLGVAKRRMKKTTFVRKAHKVLPKEMWALVEAENGFCPDPGIFHTSIKDEVLIEVARMAKATIKDWSTWKTGAANRALSDMSYLGDVEDGCVSLMDDYYDLLLNKHSQSLIFVSDFIMPTLNVFKAHSLKVLVFELMPIVEAAVDGEVATSLVSVEGKYNAKVNSAWVKLLDSKEYLEAAFQSSTLFKMVNGQHKRYGRHGSLYSEQLKGLGKEVGRAKVLLNLSVLYCDSEI